MKKQIGLNTIIEVLSRGVNFIITIIISRVLGVNALGLISSAQAISAYITLIADFGTNNEAIRRISKDSETIDKVFSIVNLYRIIVGILVLISASLLGLLGHITSSILIIFILVAIISSFFPNYIFFGLKQFKYNGYMNIINSGSTFFIFLLFLTFQKNIIYFPISLIIGASLALIFSMYIVSTKYTKLTFFEMKEFKSFVRNSFLLGFTMVFGRIYYDFDIIMLSIMRNQEEVGLYSAAFKIIQILWFVPQMYVTYALPIMSGLITNEDKSDLRKYIQSILAYTIVLILPIIVFAVNYSKDFLVLIFGKSFQDASIALSILLCSFIILCFKTIFGNIMIANTQEKTLVKLSIFGSIFNILLNILLIPRIGIVGSAISTLLTETVLLIIEMVSVRNHFKYKFPWGSLIKALISILIITIVSYYINLNLFFEILIIIFFYIVLLITLKEATILRIFNYIKKWSGKNV